MEEPNLSGDMAALEAVSAAIASKDAGAWFTEKTLSALAELFFTSKADFVRGLSAARKRVPSCTDFKRALAGSVDKYKEQAKANRKAASKGTDANDVGNDEAVSAGVNEAPDAQKATLESLIERAYLATVDDVPGILDDAVRASLTRTEQDSLLYALNAATGVTMKALRGDLISALKVAGVIADRKSVSTILVGMALEAGIKLWHDTRQEPWATIPIEGHIEHWPMRSKAVRRFLSRLYYEKTETAAHSEGIQGALGVLEAKACFDGEEHPTFLRIAETDGRVYIDLANDGWQVVEVDAQGWRVVEAAQAPAHFRRAGGMRPLPMPVKGGKLDDLADLLNIDSDKVGWRIIKAFLVSLARSGLGGYAVLVGNGEQGSGKSTAMMLLRSVIDPNDCMLRTLPRESRDLFIAASNSWVLAFDNISGVSAWLSDDLCRLATGGGLATRELYSDCDETLLSAKRPILLNGIEE